MNFRSFLFFLVTIWSAFISPALSDEHQKTMKGAAELGLESPEMHILRHMERFNHTIWGFVIYRCTYEDDSKWEKFKNLVKERHLYQIRQSDVPQLEESLQLRYIEDRKFEGASKEMIRKHFVNWTKSEEAWKEQKRDIPFLEKNHQLQHSDPRYTFPIYINKESLQSVLDGPQPPEYDLYGKAFVIILDSDWKHPSEITFDHIEDYQEWTSIDEEYMPIEGLTAYDVGWMKMNIELLNSNAYSVLLQTYMWMYKYHRPPKVWLG